MITGITRKATLSLLGVGLLVVALDCGPAATPTPSPTPTATTAPRATQPSATSTPTPTATATPTPTLPVLAPTPTPGTTVQVPQPKSPVGTITFVVPSVPSGVGLNRAQAPESYMYLGITEQLFRPQGDELVGPWLATDWQIAPDFSQATITIRSGVQFHKGWGELTAHDIAWSANDTNAAITPPASTVRRETWLPSWERPAPPMTGPWSCPLSLRSLGGTPCSLTRPATPSGCSPSVPSTRWAKTGCGRTS